MKVLHVDRVTDRERHTTRDKQRQTETEKETHIGRKTDIYIDRQTNRYRRREAVTETVRLREKIPIDVRHG